MKFNVRIPSQLGEAYSKMFPGRDLRSKLVVLTKVQRSVSISFIGDKLRLAPKYAEDFFAESVYEITRHMKSLLWQPSGRGIATIIMVGGFAESPMLIQGIKSAFPEMRVIIPLEAAWSVLRGAVIFGHDPSLSEKDAANILMVLEFMINLILRYMTKNTSMKKMEKHDAVVFSVNL